VDDPVTATLISQPLDLAAGDRPRTAFDRNVLPGFARWLVGKIEEVRPDYLVPAETKGARVLEAVIAYARDELGTPIEVPVLYRTALAYMDEDALKGSVLMIVDDAVRSGNNLAVHREHVESCGARAVHAVVCIGLAAEGAEPPPAECYRLVDDPDLYREYVWQLTELIVARGLPPEVDHHVFELRLPGRLPAVWDEIQEVLSRYGDLSLDAPADSPDRLAGLTLHYPRLPGHADYPEDGPVRCGGPDKVRLFPDVATDRVYVVPVSFPALDLPASAAAEATPEEALEWLRRWSGRANAGVGAAIVEEARRLAPETLFRTLSAYAEVDLVRGLARALAAALPDGELSLTTDRNLFHRLYGRAAGERIAERIDEEVAAALAQPPTDAPPEARPVLPLDTDVEDGTRAVAERLKALYEERRTQLGHAPVERVGLSLAEITAGLGGNRLLASRCMDYGLAMTTLVPYVDSIARPDGTTSVERRYRVAEANRDEEPYEDIDAVDQEVSEEVVALIAWHVRHRCPRFADAPVPAAMVRALVAILRPFVLESHRIALRVRPGEPEPILTLRDGVRPVTLDQVTSPYFELDEQGVTPTDRFTELWDDGARLRIDRRDLTQLIEAPLDLLIPPLQTDAPTPRLLQMLESWALVTDERLGLTHVQHALGSALDAAERPLRAIIRGPSGTRSPAPTATTGAGFVSVARERLAALSSGWLQALHARLSTASRREQLLGASVPAPWDDEPVYELPGALIELVSAVAGLSERLDLAAASAAPPADADLARDAGRVAAVTVAGCLSIERALTSMSDEIPAAPDVGDGYDALVAAAERLLVVIARLRAFTAAVAGVYRGRTGVLTQPARAHRRRAAVLFADLAKSYEHALRNDRSQNARWKNDGLGLVAQWGRAFGGTEGRDRQGDDVWLEFERVGDPAVLCAAAVQMHTSALRSTGVADMWWGLRLAVDVGELTPGDGGNTIGERLDRAAKLAKALDDEPSIERTLVTFEAAELCSPALREPPLAGRLGKGVRIASAQGEGAELEPQVVDAGRTILALAARGRAAAARVAASIVPVADEQQAIELRPLDSDSDRDEGLGEIA
jgi:adenine/guanine phosphoribosyltransferase-like PRPP-binding protein